MLRRQYTRIPITGTVSFLLSGQQCHMGLLDVSPGGFASTLSNTPELTIGQQVLTTLQFSDARLKCPAEIVYCSRGRVGYRILALDARSRDMLRQVVSQAAIDQALRYDRNAHIEFFGHTVSM
ncbi:MAG: PilZ domain-containing protein [Halieaceae bacterium]|nr:PilZ domain-containing protein [Halieaceae bacterium]